MKKYFLPVSLIINLGLICVIVWMHHRHVKTITDIYTPNDSVITFSYNKYKMFAERQAMHNLTPLKKGDIVFVGNSLTEGFPVTTLFNDLRVRNRGISNNNSNDILKRIGSIAKPCPAKIFLMVGINDIGQHIPKDKTFANIAAIVKEIKELSPKTTIIFQSILPMVGADNCKLIMTYNVQLKQWCAAKNIQYIDLFPHFYDGELKKKYSFDGMHLTAAAYALWTDLLRPYVN